MKKPTYIDGIASSQAIDTAGEIVDLKGLDISSLVGGVMNWEHKADVPEQVVGKILEAHKIFSKEDCQNDRHLYYWNKIQIPFLYVMGRLLDDKKSSAAEAAALFKDDYENPGERPLVSFSIEGSRLGDKKGMIVPRSIARKLTITNLNANKTCVAEMLPERKEAPGLDSLFKGELVLFKYEDTLEKREDKIPGGIGDKLKEEDVDPEQLKMGIKAELEHTSDESIAKEIALDHLAEDSKYYSKLATMEGKDLKKALEAGSGNAAPSELSGGAALAKEDVKKNLKKGEKSQWYSRAEEAYKTWDKRPHFVEFMKKRMPHLAEGEVDAIGRVMALNKTLKAEKKLKGMYAGGMSKSETPLEKVLNTEYIHGLPKGHPALTEYKGHTLRRGREPKPGGGWHWKWHVKHPEGHTSIVHRPAETGGFASDIHQHIDSTLKDKKK